MKRKQILSALSGAFYAIAVMQLADYGFTTLAIVSLALGSIMMTLLVKEKKDGNDGSK